MTCHRLFIDMTLPEDAARGRAPRRDLRWARAMDVAIARAGLALAHGLGAAAGRTAQAALVDSLPAPGQPEYLAPTVEARLRAMALPEDGPWSAEQVCHFVLALAHRQYAWEYEAERWLATHFKTVPVGLPRSRNKTPTSRNYTPHGISSYRRYQPRLIMGTMTEVPVVRHWRDGHWLALGEATAIALTTTNETHWLHTRITELPALWSLIDELVDAVRDAASADDSADALIEVVGLVAQVHWWMSHAMPYRRGSAAVADMLTKALLQSHQITTPCWRAGFAPDLEAFCTPLDVYITHYTSLFVTPPRFVNGG